MLAKARVAQKTRNSRGRFVPAPMNAICDDVVDGTPNVACDASAGNAPNQRELGTGASNTWHLSGLPPIPAFKITADIFGKPTTMELDTGASVSVMSADKFKAAFPDVSIEPSGVLLIGFSGNV